MQERRKEERKKNPAQTPTAEEIAGYFESIRNGKIYKRDRKDFFSRRIDQIQEGTSGVRLVTDEGVYLGSGVVGSYDWFTLKSDSKGEDVGNGNMHFANSSRKFNMVTLKDPFDIETAECKELIKLLRP